MITELPNDCKMETLTPMEKFALARFCYNLGIFMWDDDTYNREEQKLKKFLPDNEFANRSYEDDPIPFDVLNKLNLDDSIYFEMVSQQTTTLENESPEYKKYLDIMGERMSKSINPKYNMKEAYRVFERLAGYELCVSPKIDGVYAKLAYEKMGSTSESSDYRFKCSISRARGDNAPINYTNNMSRIAPKAFTTEENGINQFVVMSGETFCDMDAVEYVSEKYDMNLKTSRSAGKSMLQNNIYLAEDYSYMKIVIHGTDFKERMSEGYDFATDLGFTVVPYVVRTYEHMQFSEFEEWVEQLIDEVLEKCDRFAEVYGFHLLLDGLVVAVDDRKESAKLETEGIYDEGSFALKVLRWAPGVYMTKVLSINFEQKASNIGLVAAVEPIKTTSGITISRVNLFNPRTLILNDITVGSEIVIMYKNETTPLFICNSTDRNSAALIEAAITGSNVIIADDWEM